MPSRSRLQYKLASHKKWLNKHLASKCGLSWKGLLRYASVKLVLLLAPSDQLTKTVRGRNCKWLYTKTEERQAHWRADMASKAETEVQSNAEGLQTQTEISVL